MLTPEGKVMTIEEMEAAGKLPDYKPVEVQTAEGEIEVWQLLPVPKDKPKVIESPREEELKKAA